MITAIECRPPGRHIAVRVKPHHPPGVFEGYWKDESNLSFKGNYYFTGDRAYQDEDGYFWFVGRSDDLIKSSGYRIGPFEVEAHSGTPRGIGKCRYRRSG